MTKLRFGIVGTGMIAGVIAEALAKSERATVTAVSSRQLENARAFLAERPGPVAVKGTAALLSRDDVDAVYLAIPTSAKEPIALAAIAAGKHVLVEKPFVDAGSVLRMTAAAAAKGVVFMDATHFVHSPRAAAIKAATAEKLGSPRSLNTTFYFPFLDRSNIRFDLKQEPMGALGDMAWYSMRAIVEYLRPAGRMTTVVSVPERDAETSAVVRAAGLVAFEGGEVSTFDVGYTADAAIMELQLLGSAGIISMDDFVLDWTNSFIFKNPGIAIGYRYRKGMTTRDEVQFVPTPAKTSQEGAMVDAFAELAASGDAAQRAACAHATLKTQEYLDAIWLASD